jgi:hypothetical protein
MKMLFSMFMAAVVLPTLVFAGVPVNEICPFTGNAVNPDFTAQVGDDTVAFCCGGCLNGFKKWDEPRKEKYVAEQKALHAKPVVIEELAVKTPYLLDVCPITGEKLGSMGDVVVEVIDGREVRFCCAACPPKFKETKKDMFAKLDALMIEQQLPYYPITTCIVSGKDLEFHGGTVDFIYGNRLFRVCSNDCKAEFMDVPSEFVIELDEEIVKAQKSSYPLDYCVIGRGPLDGMGGPDHMIVGNRLIELCCAGCRPKILKDPLAAFAEIDKAKK